MKEASESFQKGQINKAIEIYSDIVQNKKEHQEEALLNRSSAYYTLGQFSKCIQDVKVYIQISEKPSVQAYILFTNSYIKLKSPVQQKDKQILQRAKEQYPYHKKLSESMSILSEIQITENQEQYLEKIFQKLLRYPPIRKFMQEQSFLAKVEKMIRNPSLAGALIKMDGRLSEVQEIILMSDA